MSSSEYTVLVLHGPNLNLLGTREPEVYGSTTLAQLDEALIAEGVSLGVEVITRQGNSEGQLVEWIQDREGYDALIINPGGYTHTSVVIRDAILAVGKPAFEVHISNIYRRESFRHQSYLADVVIGRVTGFGVMGYTLALQGAVQYLNGL
jgi:3-dehydroquinate dehydratase-2